MGKDSGESFPTTTYRAHFNNNRVVRFLGAVVDVLLRLPTLVRPRRVVERRYGSRRVCAGHRLVLSVARARTGRTDYAATTRLNAESPEARGGLVELNAVEPCPATRTDVRLPNILVTSTLSATLAALHDCIILNLQNWSTEPLFRTIT
ncbi:hypothetical protein EVAR_41834_1 [Eumeta japonica]|uniref:Uncharacterized protein n=1 Tax=Eumeta variegata TaxID=151549 RepID=A0A4C1XCH7_EUMVA|nr:hypothetical protein EVAR_41834_1 [Eumeta japonica]